ncbi:glycosyltransferase [Phytohabitans kaempferiae]|uniref:Glycosyltransferase n=1 Tax=Phytohabitans kaempferiae TaxID=1620943 RepID=A0ABV6M5A1_9ACTN
MVDHRQHAHGGVPSVGVLVELARGAEAGGHVKCWERLAEAAAARDPTDLGFDLTVYFLGRRSGVEALSRAVRYVTMRPVISSALLTRWIGGVDPTDLAPYHPALARRLPHHDVWHVTHAFAFGGTATRLPRPAGTALMCSLHTDVPTLTAAYVRQVVERTPALRWLARRHPNGPPMAVDAARRRRDRVLRACDRIMVATPTELAAVERIVGAGRVSLLGRGIDRVRFRPDPAARADLVARHGLPPGEMLVLFAGRVDASKRVMVVAEAVLRLRESGRPARLVVAGTGADCGRVPALLGNGVTMLGRLPQPELARVYPACDVLAFPSRSETIGNVVAEAMACGLPVVLPAGARTTAWLSRPGVDGLVVERDDPAGWAEQLGVLADHPEWRASLGRGAYASARYRHRTWDQVLTEDLLPFWLPAGARTGG